MFERLSLLSAGESHGPELSAIIDGLPAGLRLDLDAIAAEMARRQRGFGRGGRMSIERDEVLIRSGVQGGETTGGPIGLRLINRDFKSWRARDIAPMTVPRPGHADLVAAVKYGYADLRPGLERASARETAMRVAAGAIARQLLSALGIELGGYALQIGAVRARAPSCELGAEEPQALREAAARALASDLACPDAEAEPQMRAAIEAAMRGRDTLGGQIEVFALGLPVGLGAYVQWHRRLDARLAFAMMSIPAMKGVELGPAFENAGRRGTEVHDELELGPEGHILRPTNRAGGLEAGVTTGAPLRLRIAKKPISTTLTPRRSVDLATGAPRATEYERSDFCAVPRAVPICEAMLALTLADALLVKLGGDSLRELQTRLASLRQARLADLELRGESWRFEYPEAPS